MNCVVEELVPGGIDGVTVALPDETAYRERYFAWQAFPLSAVFGNNEVSGGVLRAWRHVPVFGEVETHVDREMFHFVSGTALMLFCDMRDGKPVMETCRIVRIRAGTQLVIEAGKGHFVAVAEGDEPVCAIVIAPRMDAPRVPLDEAVTGVAK